MNSEHIEGMWEEWGKFTNNDLVEVEGDYYEFLDAVKAWTDTWPDEHQEHRILPESAEEGRS